MSEPAFALRTPHLAGARVAVVGLGLMGGSLAAALQARHAGSTIIGIARRQEAVDRALALGYVDEGTVDLAQGVAAADIVVLATPVRTILASLPQLAALLPPGVLLVDLGSTKARIAAAMAALPAHVHVCPAHPMCGKEVAGLEAADPHLYAGKTFVVCPLERTRPEALALVEELALAIDARPLRLDPARHDRLVALSSHLPYLLALSLMAAAEQTGREDPCLWDVVASGFRDTSRLAGSSVPMMLDVLLTNPIAIAEALATVRGELERMEQLLVAGDEDALRTVLAAGAQRRASMAFPETRSIEQAAGMPGAEPPTGLHASLRPGSEPHEGQVQAFGAA